MFSRYIGWAGFFMVLNFAFRFLIVFPFFGGGWGSEKTGMFFVGNFDVFWGLSFRDICGVHSRCLGPANISG